MIESAFYQSQSVFTDPGEFDHVWDQVPANLAAMKDRVHPLVFHYFAQGDISDHGIHGERISEVNLRYADDMLRRIEELKPIGEGAERSPAQRMVGCCRDWAVLLVSLARHHDMPARIRVGFADYFVDGWWLDHTITEVWDLDERRWRRIDAQLSNDFIPGSGQPFSPLDIPPGRFLSGLDAWRVVRAGVYDAGIFSVVPDVEETILRGINYLKHNVFLDLAALNKFEMILWDGWGDNLLEPNEDLFDLLDTVAVSETPNEWTELFRLDALHVPETVQSMSPYEPHERIWIKLR